MDRAKPTEPQTKFKGGLAELGLDGRQLVSTEPPELWSAGHNDRMNTSYRETQQQQPEINPTRTALWRRQEPAGRRFKVLLAPPNGGAWKLADWCSRHSLADPGQICYCSSTVLRVESLWHCPNALSGGNSWTDQHQVQETSTSTRAPLGARGLFGRPSILPACPSGTPDQPQGLHGLNRHLRFLPPFAWDKIHVFVWHSGNAPRGGEVGSPGFNLPVNRNQGASKQAADNTQLYWVNWKRTHHTARKGLFSGLQHRQPDTTSLQQCTHTGLGMDTSLGGVNFLI